MASLNSCSFIGNVGKEPTVRYSPDGKAVANFSLAVNESWKDKSGTKQTRTEWVRMSAFGPLAGVIEKYVHKGDPLYVSGRMQTREWEKDGVKRYTTEVVVSEMQMLGSRPTGDDASKPEAQTADAAPDFDDDIPF